MRSRLFVWLIVICTAGFVLGAPRPIAELTRTAGDVEWVGGAAAEKANMGQTITGPNVLRTKRDSRAELKAKDGAVARIGGDTVAKIDNGRVELESGLLLVQSPRHRSLLALRAHGIGAAVSGTTTLLEYHEPAFKFLVLQGTARLYRPGHWGDSVLVRAGQMVFGKTNGPLNDAVDFKLDRFLKTCRLLNELGPLPDNDIMVAAANEQNGKHRDAKLIETNLVIFGEGTAVTLTKDGNDAGNADSDTTGTPAPSIRSGAATITAPTQTAVDARHP